MYFFIFVGQIYESTIIGTTNKKGSIFLPLPLENDFFEDTDYQEIQFSSPQLKYSKRKIYSDIVSGIVKLKLGFMSNQMTPPATTAERIPPRPKMSIQNQLISWYDDQFIDPLDPENKNIIKHLTLVRKCENPVIENKLFRFNEDLTAFCTEEEFNENIRFNLLKERSDQPLKYANVRLIPQFDREIEMPEEKTIIEETLGMDPIDLQRHRGKKYLKKVYETISHNIKLLQKDNEDCNILTGDEIPTFG